MMSVDRNGRLRRRGCRNSLKNIRKSVEKRLLLVNGQRNITQIPINKKCQIPTPSLADTDIFYMKCCILCCPKT